MQPGIIFIIIFFVVLFVKSGNIHMITSFQNSGLIPLRVYQFFYFKQLYYGIIEIHKLKCI